MLGNKVNKPHKKPKFLGLRRMYKAFDYFYDRLNEIDDNGNSIFTYSKAQEFLNKLNMATIVKIDVIVFWCRRNFKEFTTRCTHHRSTIGLLSCPGTSGILKHWPRFSHCHVVCVR